LQLGYTTDDGSARQRQVSLWYPATGKDQPFNYSGQKGFAVPDAPVAPGRHALVLFSHGFLGYAEQSLFLTESLARDGFIVAAINHADATTPQRKQPVAWSNFVEARKWNASNFRDRRDDMVALLDHLLKLDQDEEAFLHQHIDRKAIGAAGHSLGGYTVMGLIGGWRSWRDGRIGAALLLSPYTLPYQNGANLPTLQMPVMLQGATLDWGITPFLKDVYNRLPGPAFYLALRNETHFAWTVLASLGKTTTDCVKQGNPKLITDYSLAFFRHHLRKTPEPLLQTKARGLDSYQFKSIPE
jgi:alpha-beta hydrolase superfamily lysophospholipase